MSHNMQYVAQALSLAGIVNAQSQRSSLRESSFSQSTLDGTSLSRGGPYGSE
jgi:hypothetical protein